MPKAPAKPTAAMAALTWLPADAGYQLALDGAKLLCRNAKGSVLASVPKAVRDSDLAEQLLATAERMARHRADSLAAAEGWMLRSLPVPAAVLHAVWPDPDWRAVLHGAVVEALDDAGRPLAGQVGVLQAVDIERGIGAVNLDGESVWLRAAAVRLPHPILLADLGDWRALASEIGVGQVLPQLLRETFARPPRHDPDAASVDSYADGSFEELRHVLGLCAKLGYRVRGGNAQCRVWEGGRVVEARYWVGEGDPEWETETGDLSWVDDCDRTLRLGDVGPVAYSEGVRMASLVYAQRVQKTKED